MKRYLIICEETCPACKPGEDGMKTAWCHTCENQGTIRKEVELAEAMRYYRMSAVTECPTSDAQLMRIANLPDFPHEGEIQKSKTGWWHRFFHRIFKYLSE